MKPMTSLAVIGASLTALGIVIVASSVEPPRVAPNAAPATPAKIERPVLQSPPPAPAPAPKSIRPGPAPQTSD